MITILWRKTFNFHRRKLAKLSHSVVIGTRHFHCSGALQNGEPAGLYGFHHLKTAKGFQRFVDESIERSGDLVNYISEMPSSKDIIRAMDEISNTVCSVVDSAELCRHTHPDREFVDEANKASIRMNEYLHHLNTNSTLYNAVKKAEQDTDCLSKEARRAAHSLCIDFEKGGIHLSAEKLDRINQLNLAIFQLNTEFGENIATNPGYVDVYPASRIPKKIHHILKPVYRVISGTSKASPMQGTAKEKGFRIATDSRSMSSTLQSVSDDKVRKLIYVQGNSAPHANVEVLDKLIAARFDLAQILGYRSYAEFVVKPNMAASPEVVMSFLHEMSGMIRPKADKEFQDIRNFKREKCDLSFVDLEPWDEAYYSALMKSAAHNLDSSVVSSYFSLKNCIDGLKVLVESLFGATFHSLPMAPGESWHPDVLKMSLHHPDEGDLGTVYLDLYTRQGKYPGCATFAIRGGRRISETDYQLPVVALICNFSGHCSSKAKLNHGDVETLFHEFGHALHSLLSRTDYQHFAGTRVALDLAETPSNLFEYYAWDYRILKRFARHCSTGEIIPEKLVNSMIGARDMFAATELQRQIFYALVDQTLFGEQPSSPRETSCIVAELKRQHTSWKHVEGTHWEIRFNHLINYGAGYYSYLYARCFAANIWQKLCQEDPLSLNTGTALRTKFLMHGGAEEPADMLNNLVGGDGIIRHVNGGITPVIASYLDELKVLRD